MLVLQRLRVGRPASGEPVDWLIRDHLRLRQALNDAEAAHGATTAERDAARRDLSRVIAERDAQVRLTDDLGARVAELEAAPSAKMEARQSPVAMLADARDAAAASGYGFVSVFSADERWFAAVVQVRDRRHAAALLRWRGGGA